MLVFKGSQSQSLGLSSHFVYSMSKAVPLASFYPFFGFHFVGSHQNIAENSAPPPHQAIYATSILICSTTPLSLCKERQEKTKVITLRKNDMIPKI